MVFPTTRIHYVRKFLKLMERLGTGPDRKLAARFVMDYLRHDGVFTLRLIGKNSSDIVVAEIISELWDMYRNKKCIQIRTNSQNPGHETEEADVWLGNGRVLRGFNKSVEEKEVEDNVTHV